MKYTHYTVYKHAKERYCFYAYVRTVLSYVWLPAGTLQFATQQYWAAQLILLYTFSSLLSCITQQPPEPRGVLPTTPVGLATHPTPVGWAAHSALAWWSWINRPWLMEAVTSRRRRNRIQSSNNTDSRTGHHEWFKGWNTGGGDGRVSKPLQYNIPNKPSHLLSWTLVVKY